ncbi:MAG: DUF1217 domain-containing protein [Sulfitobacter sp.]
MQRDSDYFSEKIVSVSSAEELVSDRRLLSVTLGAFGLQDDIVNRYFIQKVLEEGATNDDALAMRLSDTRYREMSEAFGFGPGEFLKVGQPDFVQAIVDRFQTNSFEVAAGAQNDAMRVALYAQRELGEIAAMEGSTNTKWFTILGDPPLRQVFEKALNLPSSIGQIDIDQQLFIFKERAKAVFGSDDLLRFADSEAREDTITKYILRNQIDALGVGLSSTFIALTLLQS